jgi:hypothetical protein
MADAYLRIFEAECARASLGRLEKTRRMRGPAPEPVVGSA